jgi:hypothetical protein
MFDRSNAVIKIGGILSSARLAAFIEMLGQERAGLDWTCASPEDLESSVWEAAYDGKFLSVCRQEAIRGRFERLEAWLVAYGLTYYRYDDGCPGFRGAAGSFWQPGLDQPAQWVVDDRGRPQICYQDVLEKSAEEIRQLAQFMKVADEFRFALEIDREYRLSVEMMED